MAFRTGRAGRLWVNGEEVYLKGFSVGRKDMTEQEWEASEDPAAMLNALRKQDDRVGHGHDISDRKLRMTWRDGGRRGPPVDENGRKGTGRLPHPILAHLREPGPHVRGCHIIDLLTGRE